MTRFASRSARLLAAGVGVALALAGCTTESAHQGGSSSSAGGASSASGSASSSGAASASGSASSSEGEGDPALASFYSQKLEWKDCDDDQCAELTVPVDYANPSGGSIKLAVLRVPSPSKNKRGSLIINPGGPGGSGVEFAQYSGQVFSGELTRAYDVVGFDPRGVGKSSPIVCLDGPKFDSFLGIDPTPDDKAEEQAMADGDKAFGAACQERNKALIGHVSTVEAAKDMDILRHVLGDEQINYFGASYGTFLGATYAGLFPKKVGRMVLDGAMDPKLTGEQLVEGQAKGFETAFNSFVEDCVKHGSCPLGDSVPQAQERVRAFLKGLDAHPVDANGQGPQGGLTEAWASFGMAYALYDQGMWGQLEEALDAAMNRGRGEKLMLMAMQYLDRDEQGNYSSNMLQVINAVNCLDRSAPADLAHYEQLQKDYTAKWPTFGPFMAWSGLVCGTWPVKATGKAGPITAAGSKPIVVVGTTRDPATPYEESVSLAEQLENGRLVSRDGDGHTGYNKGNRCVDKAVDDYLIRDKDPGKLTKC